MTAAPSLASHTPWGSDYGVEDYGRCLQFLVDHLADIAFVVYTLISQLSILCYRSETQANIGENYNAREYQQNWRLSLLI